MPESSQLKGYLFAFGATLAGSLVYIFSKAALKEVSLPQFGVYWFSMAIAWNSLLVFRKKERRSISRLGKSNLKFLLLIGLIELVATGAFYASIQASLNPTVPSFLRNLEYIFVTLLGVWLLGEKFSGIQRFGVFLTFSGALVISYKPDANWQTFLTGGTGLMLISTLFYGFRTILAKKHIKQVGPTLLALNRAFFLLTLAMILILSFRESFIIPRTALINIAIGSFFGPFLTSITQYSALKYIEASKAAIIQSSTGLAVLFIAYFWFGNLPLPYQIVGGLFTIGGVTTIMLGRRGKQTL
jgi:drug/metabolite transporter (DMT)-like permease